MGVHEGHLQECDEWGGIFAKGAIIQTLLEIAGNLTRTHQANSKREMDKAMSTYTKGTDSKGQPYVEMQVQEKTESVRITFVREGYPGKPCIRIQIHPHGEKLRPGPEFSIEYTPQFFASLMDLVMSSQI